MTLLLLVSFCLALFGPVALIVNWCSNQIRMERAYRRLDLFDLKTEKEKENNRIRNWNGVK